MTTTNDSSTMDMYVTKRSGVKEPITFDKIQTRIRRLFAHNSSDELPSQLRPLTNVKCTILTMKIIDQIYDNITTTKIDELTAEQCASMSSIHSDYGELAGRIVVSNHHKNTTSSFLEVTDILFNNQYNGCHTPMLSREYYDNVQWYANYKELVSVDVQMPNKRGTSTVTYTNVDAICDFNRDYLIDFFGFKTVEKAYLLKTDNIIRERPQHLWLRVAIGIHGRNVKKVLETYTYLSNKMFTHATPTLFNAGTNYPQLSSCFLSQMESDSITGIFNTLSDSAKISKHAGGVGVSIHNIRANGSMIRGTGGVSNGIVPMLKVFESTALYVDQGGGKRNGSFAIYLEPWHADIEAFLQLRMNHGAENLRARKLFYALWLPDLFMERVRDNKNWTLMCPDKCPGLHLVYGSKFVELYEQYERDGKGNQTIMARDLWLKMLDAQMETGTPYMLFKDAVNRASNQKNLGTIQLSNLCCEIVEFTSKEESAVCNLASIALPSCVVSDDTDPSKMVFDFEKLVHLAGAVGENLDRLIDVSLYPVEKNRLSNTRHRPIGMGVQGMADVFLMMDMAFDSPEAKKLNRQMFETLYFGAISKSAELAELHGAYESFAGSPASEGLLQFDLHIDPTTGLKTHSCCPELNYDWGALKARICKTGLRNSMSVALMPTASTSQILGFNECIEPITSNIYSRSTIAGDFMVVNKYLIRELTDLGIWSDTVKNGIIANKGSIQHLKSVSDHVRLKYRTVWEISMRDLINMAADRGVFVCQSQSMNLWVADPTYKLLTAMHMHSWKSGLKTGIYYLRRLPRYTAQQFFIEPSKEQNEPVCDVCSA